MAQTIATITQPVTGTAPSSTAYGIPVKANVDFLTGATSGNTKPLCVVYYGGAGQSLSAATVTTITLDTEPTNGDNDGMHTGTNGFFTIQTAGWYRFVGQITMSSAASGRLLVQISQNGTTICGQYVPAQTSNASQMNVSSPPTHCAVSDVITLQGYSTVANTTTAGIGVTFMSAEWLRS
jgi:hypothetical protein